MESPPENGLGLVERRDDNTLAAVAQNRAAQNRACLDSAALNAGVAAA